MKPQKATNCKWIKNLILLNMIILLSFLTKQSNAQQNRDSIIILQKTSSNTLDTVKQKGKSEQQITDGEVYIYNTTKNGVKKYYDHYGNELDSKGERLASPHVSRSTQTANSNLIASGQTTINGKDYFYAETKAGTKKYYDRFGNQVNNKGASVETTEIANTLKSNKNSNASLIASGQTTINSKDHFYAKAKDGNIIYFDQFGNEIDSRGKQLKSPHKIDMNSPKSKIDNKSILAKSGTILINGKVYFYAESKDGTLEYYDKQGNEVNAKGELMSSKNK